MAESELVFKVRTEAGDAAAGFKDIKAAWDSTASDLAKPAEVAIETSKAEASISQLDKTIKSAFKYEPPVVDLDTDPAEKKVALLEKNVNGQEVMKGWGDPALDLVTKPAETKVDQLETKVGAFKYEPPEVDLDTGKAEDKVALFQKDLRGTQDVIKGFADGAKIDVETKEASTKIEKVSTLVKKLDDKPLDIEVKTGGLSNAESKVSRFGTALDKIKTKAKATGSGLKTSFGDLGKGIAGNLDSVSGLQGAFAEFGTGALAALGPVGVAIGIVAGAAVGLGAGLVKIIGGARDLVGELTAMGNASEITESDLKSLAGKGVPAAEMLASAMGKSKQEIYALGKAGKLGTEELAILEAQMNQRYGAGFIESGKELNSSFTAIKQDFADMANSIAAEAMPIVNSIMPAIVDAVQGLSDWVTANGPSIAGAFGKIGEGVLLLASLTNASFTTMQVAMSKYTQMIYSLSASISTAFGSMAESVGGMLKHVPGMEEYGTALESWGKYAKKTGDEYKVLAQKEKEGGDEALLAGQKREQSINETRTALKAATEQAKLGAEYKIDVKATDDAIANTKSKIKDLQRQKATAKTDVDKKAFDVKIKAAKADLKELQAHKAELSVDLNTAQAAAKIKALKTDVTGYDKQLASLGRKEVTPTIKANIEELERKRAKALADLASLGDKTAIPTIKGNIADLDAKIKKSKADLQALQDKRTTAKTDLQKASFDEKIKKAKGDLQSLQDKKTEAKVTLNTAEAAAKITSLRGKIKGYEGQISSLSKKKATPKITADIKDLQAKKKKAEGEIKSLGGKSSTVKIKGDSKGAQKAGKEASKAAKDVPKEKEVKIKGDSKSVKSASKEATSAVKGVPKSKETHLSVTGLGSYKSDIASAKAAANSIPATRTTNVRINRTTTNTTVTRRRTEPAAAASMITPTMINMTQAPPSISLYVRDEALADFIDVRVNGQVSKSARVFTRKGTVTL